MADRAVEAELREALRAAARLKVAAAEAEAAAGTVADKVRRGEVAPADISREVKKEVARGNVQRRVGGAGKGRLADDVRGETRAVEDLTKAERENRLESARSAREKATLSASRAKDTVADVRKAEGQLKAAETRLRKLNAEQGVDPARRSRYEATVGRAQARVTETRAAQQAAYAEAQRSHDVARRLRAEERIEQVERRRTALQPRTSAGGGGADVVRYLDRHQRLLDGAPARAASGVREDITATRKELQQSERAAGGLARDLERVRGGGTPAGAAGGGRRPPPPPPPAPPGGAGFQGDPEERRQVLQRTIAAERQMALAEAQLRSEFQRTSVVLGSQSDILRRHGALTTEFIAAAARGETTFRELGYQAGATIGKFAGWLGAGAAVFFAVDAVRNMYEGAIQADRGVANLDRVIKDLDRDAARVQLGSLADEFNVPVADAADAVFQMGKVFHDQEGAFKAARAVLYSVKVGELDVADASRYLIAIVNGFKLPAREMATVFDQINQAQNRFGVSIRDTEAGVAKAAGTYKAAGGDVSSLLALITTAQKVTGNTGEVIGTAIARSPNFLRKPQNVEILRQYGIDATAPIPEIFRKAFEKARTLSGEELQKLAAAIGGPQYGARVFTPLLQNADLFRKVMRETSREASQNSAANELEQTLDAVSERIAAVGIGLQQLGAELSAAGVGSIFVFMVDSMNTALDVTNAILGVFNKLPEPIRHALTLWAQLAIVMRGLQRFRFGEFLQDRGVAPGIARRFNQPDDRYVTRLARRGARDEKTYLRDDLQRATSAQRLAQREALVITQRERGLQRAINRQLQAQNLDAETQAKLKFQQAASVARVTAAQEAVLATEARQVTLTQELANVEQRNAILNGRRNTVRAAEVAAATRGVYIPGTLERPTAVPPIIAPGGRRDQFGVDYARARSQQTGRPLVDGRDQFGLLAAQGQAERSMAVNEAREAAARERVIASKRTLAQEFRRARTQFPALGAAGAAVIGGARRLASDSGRASTVLRGAGRSIGGAARGLGRMAAGLGAIFGPLDLLLIAATIGIPLALEQVKKNQEKARSLARAPHSARDARALQRELEKDAGLGFAEQGNALARDILPFPFALIGEDPRVKDQRNAERAKRLEALNRHRRVQSQRGGIIHQAFPENIDESIQTTVSEYQQGEITLTRALQRLRNALDSIAESHQGEAAKRQQASLIRARIIDLDPSNRNLFKRLSQIGTDVLKQRAEEYEALIGAGGAGNKDITRYSTILNALALRFARKPGLKSRRAFAEISRQQIAGLQSQAQEELSTQLATAQTDRERAAAYRRYENILRRGVRRGQRQALRGLRSMLRTDRVEVRGIQVSALELLAEARALAAEGSLALIAPSRAYANSSNTHGSIAGPVRQARKLVQQRRRQMRDIRRFFRRQMQEIGDVMEEMTGGLGGDDENDAAALYQAQTELGQYRYRRGLPRIQYQIQRIGGAISQAIREHGRNSVEVLQLMGEQASLQEQAWDESYSILQAQGQIREAGLEGAQLIRVQLSNIGAQINFLQGHQGSQAEILQLVAQQKQLQHELLLSAREDIESLYELRIARTEDPVRQARLEYQRDRAIRRRLSGAVSPQEQRRLRAQEIRSRRTLRDRIVEEELGDLQHRDAIGRLTNDQEIRALERLLRTHKMSRDLRRRIKEQIYQLRNESETELDLDVGNIRLPTAYDIRRIAAQGTQTAPSSVLMQNNSFTFNVRNQGDAETIGSAIDSIYGTQTRAQMRSAGLT